MNKTLLLFALIILSVNGALGQDLLPSAAVPATINTNGDPTTNIMDPDGMKQGDWFYADHTGNHVLIEKYQDNSLTETYYSRNGDWNVASKQIPSAHYQDLKNSLPGIIADNGITIDPLHQQIVAVVGASGEIKALYFLGQWSAESVQNLKPVIINYVEENAESSSTDFLIII